MHAVSFYFYFCWTIVKQYETSRNRASLTRFWNWKFSSPKSLFDSLFILSSTNVFNAYFRYSNSVQNWMDFIDRTFTFIALAFLFYFWLYSSLIIFMLFDLVLIQKMYVEWFLKREIKSINMKFKIQILA